MLSFRFPAFLFSINSLQIQEVVDALLAITAAFGEVGGGNSSAWWYYILRNFRELGQGRAPRGLVIQEGENGIEFYSSKGIDHLVLPGLSLVDFLR